MYSEELCASVVGFSNNCYRCCESIEEGRQALAAFVSKRAVTPSPAAIAQIAPRHTPSEHQHGRISSADVDDSWWCCFAGAEPGVYQGL